MSDIKAPFTAYLRQHLIDPERCIRCASCEQVCAAGAISHTANFVIDPDKCNGCLDCLAECPTGAVDNWRIVAREHIYTLPQQHAYTVLPEPLRIPAALVDPSWTTNRSPRERSSTAPRSAPLPQLNLFDPQRPAFATVRANQRITAQECGSDIHHIVLDLGALTLPWIEGQTIGILPPGQDENGKPHLLRLYSIASSRDGETPGPSNMALTVKRMVEDHSGKPTQGTASNFLCNLDTGAQVRITGPYGASFLMPDDPAARLLMIATGTGIAPMRAMIQRRQRVNSMAAGNTALFYGGRAPSEMPYHDDLVALASQGLQLHLAYSREPAQSKKYVQALLIEQRDYLLDVLRDENAYLYLCGLRGMEQGVMETLQRICGAHRLDWPALHESMLTNGRLHIETY